MKTFRMTFDVVTEESARHGDFAYHGFVTRAGNFPRRNGGYLPNNPARFTIRDALEMMDEHDDGREPREADSSLRWFQCSSYDGEESTTLALLLGDVTPSTARRIARIAGVALR